MQQAQGMHIGEYKVTHLLDHSFLYTLRHQAQCPVGMEVNTINILPALLEVTINYKKNNYLGNYKTVVLVL